MSSSSAIDFKRRQKELYAPTGAPTIVNVPRMQFLAVDGVGDPNVVPEYSSAVELLYGVAYGIKMLKKQDTQPEGYIDFVVPPLEGLWSVSDPSTAFHGGELTDKSQLLWTMMIRMPEFVIEEFVRASADQLAQKKNEIDPTRIRLHTYDEGQCVQIMHTGPYATEPESTAKMEQLAQERGFRVDLTGERRHHEIYLSDPRRTEPAKWKTVIRHPVVPHP